MRPDELVAAAILAELLEAKATVHDQPELGEGRFDWLFAGHGRRYAAEITSHNDESRRLFDVRTAKAGGIYREVPDLPGIYLVRVATTAVPSALWKTVPALIRDHFPDGVDFQALSWIRWNPQDPLQVYAEMLSEVGVLWITGQRIPGRSAMQITAEAGWWSTRWRSARLWRRNSTRIASSWLPQTLMRGTCSCGSILRRCRRTARMRNAEELPTIAGSRGRHRRAVGRGLRRQPSPPDGVETVACGIEPTMGGLDFSSPQRLTPSGRGGQWQRTRSADLPICIAHAVWAGHDRHMPLVDIAFDTRLTSADLARIADVLRDVVPLAVECPEEPIVGPLAAGDLEIRFGRVASMTWASWWPSLRCGRSDSPAVWRTSRIGPT